MVIERSVYISVIEYSRLCCTWRYHVVIEIPFFKFVRHRIQIACNLFLI